MGEWIADYLEDNGYGSKVPPSVIQLLIMRSFPSSNEKTSTLYTEAKCQERQLARKLQFLNTFSDLQDEAERLKSRYNASVMKLLLSESTVRANMR